ncbi:hypothetical protein BB559_003127 [Furculomyces boomerangus]|uniref:Uncharacterized protein n=2 Tax=Harpellales TaxID=61421 RepID=A0A2T9YNX3_9FUNG|nr:hypothetical protein BB559_003127 [Furculomyces boomerangus]PWA00120.1 hypothetical protein BB558_003847 [Smittium angustum]
MNVLDSGPFDFSEIDDKEIWFMRIPNKFDLNSIKDFSFDKKKSKKSNISSTSSIDGSKYDLIEVSNDSSSGGIEMKGFNILLPDAFDSQEYSLFPQSNSRMFIVKESIELPDLTLAGEKAVIETKPKQRKQLENMKQMFVPYGSNLEIAGSVPLKKAKLSNETTQTPTKAKTEQVKTEKVETDQVQSPKSSKNKKSKSKKSKKSVNSSMEIDLVLSPKVEKE